MQLPGWKSEKEPVDTLASSWRKNVVKIYVVVQLSRLEEKSALTFAIPTPPKPIMACKVLK